MGSCGGCVFVRKSFMCLSALPISSGFHDNAFAENKQNLHLCARMREAENLKSVG